MKKYFLLILFCTWAAALPAAVFTSTDGNISLELSTGWSFARKPMEGSVLSVVKDTARIDIKKVPNCATEACLEKKIQADLAQVKHKKMQVLGNTYTGEDIQRIDFSTGESLLYINFVTSKNEFSAGYFPMNKQGYSILAKGLSYAQAESIFRFISPARKIEPQTQELSDDMQLDLASTRAYDIEALPDVKEETLQAPTVPVVQDKPVSSATRATAAKKARRLIRKIPRTFVTAHMPPYIRHMGHWFDVVVLLLLAYLGLQATALLVRAFIRPQLPAPTQQGASLYPIQFRRRYGTPSLIFRAKDNQGHILVSLTNRWDSLFLFGGLLLVFGAIGVMALMGISEQIHILPLSLMTYNMVYSALALIIPLGFVVFLCGVLWSRLVLRQFTLYDNHGHKIVQIVQRGFGFKKETYLAYFLRSKEVLELKRKSFCLLREWTLSDKQGQLLAHIKENNKPFAIIRKFTGHLWGFLHASYDVQTASSRGKIQNARALYNRFTATLEPPQTLAARNLLVAALVINIRDRDKWYPWF